MASDIQIRIRRDLQQQTVKAFQDLGAYTKQLTIDLCKEEAALTAREAINMSPPLDGGNGQAGSGGGKGDKPVAKRWGEWAVVYDVMTVVTEDSKSLAVAISSSRNNRAKFDKWRQGKPPKSAGIVSKIWAAQNGDRAFKMAQNLFKNWGKRRLNFIDNVQTLQARHDQARKLYRGRIRKNGGKDAEGKLKGQPFTFAPYKIIKDYIKQRQQRVGWMKAGWVYAINKIGKPVINGMETSRGLRKLPTWITRHNATHGKVGINISQGSGDNNVMIQIRNDLGNIFGVGYLAGTRMYVIAARQGKLQKKLNRFMRIAIEKANKGQTPT
jgi:hypothetical protein